MIIQPTSLAAQLWAGAAAGTTAAADAWRVGTLLTAKVMGQNDLGKLLLEIGGITVEADTAGTQLPQQFQVRVLTQGAQPQLEVVAGNVDERVAMQGLRERLPQQNGYAPLLGVLATLGRSPVARSLPAPLRAALATLEASISRPDDVASPAGMKEAIARSGAFLESHLAQPHAETPAADDFKAALLSLRRVRADLPPTRSAGNAGNGTVLPRPLSDTPPPLAQRPLVAQPRMAELAVTEEDVDTLVGQLRT
ncbi:MAG: flagellar hook-length control protein FliK, partial [Luteibacter sp.]